MTPYLIFLACVILFYYCSFVFRYRNGFSVFTVLTYIILVLFAGLRNGSVGTDTNSYIASFQRIGRVDFAAFDIASDFGYAVLERIALTFSGEYYSLLIATAMVFVFCSLKAIQDLSINPVISLFVFITLGYYTFSFNGARQGIAMAIYMLSFRYLLSSKFIYYCFWVLIAGFFHKTIIVAIPLYFLFNSRFSFFTFFLMVVSSILIFYYFQVLVGFGASINPRYLVYLNRSESKGEMLTLFYAIMTLYFVFFRQFIPLKERKFYDRFLNMSITGTIIYLIVIFTNSYIELTRFAAYFQISSIFLWPFVLKNTEESIKPGLMIGLVVVCIAFFIVFIGRMAGLTPYVFNQTIFGLM